MSAADFRARQRAKRLATCRHFTGLQNDTCAVGVRYMDVRDASKPGPYRWPCLGECATTCEKRAPKTEAEIDEEDLKRAEMFAAVVRARAAIVDTGKSAGVVNCPRCGGADALRFRVSSCNGHVHAACSTPNCLAWME